MYVPFAAFCCIESQLGWWKKKNYSSVPKSVLTNISSFDNKEYVCITCLSKVVKGKIPCQAVYNDMSVDEIPPELALLEKLEQEDNP